MKEEESKDAEAEKSKKDPTLPVRHSGPQIGTDLILIITNDNR